MASSEAWQRFRGSEVVVKLLCGREERSTSAFQGKGVESCHVLFSLRDGKSPIKEIAHVRENLRGGAGLVSDVKTGEMFRSATQGFCRAISNRSNAVAEKIACGLWVVVMR